MKQKYLLIASISAMLLLFGCTAKAQSPSFDSLLTQALETDELLPLLIDSALKYSPEIKRLARNVDGLKENLIISKNFIFSAVNANSSFAYGTNYSAITNQNTTSAGSNITNAQSGFYNVGIGIQLPITHLINRKHLIKSGKAQIEMAKSEKDVTAYNVKMDVIRLYYQFKLAHKLVAVASRNKQSAQINYAMVEKDFIQGQVTVSQLSVVNEVNNKSMVDFETNISNFQMMYLQLETLTNTNLLTLLKQVK